MVRETLEHCERRAAEEKKAAEEASCIEAAVAHRGLAEKYLAKAKALRARHSASSEAMEGSRPVPTVPPSPSESE